MSYGLGIDTGGTYTDAVIVKDGSEVVASGKALTTRHDLSEGIGNAVSSVLAQADVQASHIGLASLSTTLATNALVEGQGGRVALVLIGFSETDVDRHGLKDALGDDPVLLLQGGHDHSGNERYPLDTETLMQWIRSQSGVSGYAIAGQFATRNAAHEIEVARLIQEQSGVPTTCSHHLSAKLNGPKRALTAVLNARLIGMIDELITRASERLKDLGVKAPLMVVRGDGALISADSARERPIETILSGPAASLVGAHWLSQQDTALVSDIGGTTTDVAMLRGGRPSIDLNGAKVGEHRTMVEAVAMRTFGLGGDSQVHMPKDGLRRKVHLGPNRVVPIALFADSHPELAHRVLDYQLSRPVPGAYDGQFIIPVLNAAREGLSQRADALLERVADTAWSLEELVTSRLQRTALKELVARGLVQLVGVTPTDACHVLELQNSWDRNASVKALSLFAMSRSGSGDRLANDENELAEMILAQLVDQSKIALLETVFAEDGSFDSPSKELARNPLLHAGLTGFKGLVEFHAKLGVPLIALGASSGTYYPQVGKAMNCETVQCEHADVANAIGAVVGQVMVKRSGTITSPTEGVFRLHVGDVPQDYALAKDAMDALEDLLSHDVLQSAQGMGVEDINLTADRQIKQASVEGQETFVEAVIEVTAMGRPRIATG